MNRPCSFAKDALRQAMNLRDRLTAIMGANVPWVEPILATPFGYTDGDALDSRVWLAYADSLTDRIAPANAPKKLTAEQIARVVNVMEMIEKDAAKVYERPAVAAAR